MGRRDMVHGKYNINMSISRRNKSEETIQELVKRHLMHVSDSP
jgi:hypothetical protein